MPMKGLQLPEHDSRPFRALTEKELDTFRRDCPDDLLPPLLAASLLGLREEEVRQLEWTDIDLNARMPRLSQKSNLRLKSQGWTGVKQFEFRIPASLHATLCARFFHVVEPRLRPIAFAGPAGPGSHLST
jgi:integrase